ncbi:immunity protein Imm33 domain-containing protein [Dictyobacter kobayashii]|uniref:Imm33-like domain-containing protein n=1 Tax=Dictyobacter kobayashii TaxID=2014872 RepID=A0A402ARI0_9CHLR|nr:hypothetical protein [Dictyobacter kobayashii]GCE21699.1 hypothetical protein KDK_54990 [Dictyobacter kobayashii]
MRIHFSARDAAPRWAVTEGLQALGQQEIRVPLFWSRGDLRDRQVADLLNVIERYIAAQSKRIVANQTLQYGWTTLRFVAANAVEGADELQAEELRQPFEHGDPHYVPGVTLAIYLLALQDEAEQRNRLLGESVVTKRAQTAITCNRITPYALQSGHQILAERGSAGNHQYSGWFIGCVEKDHNHNDTDQLLQVHLSHLITSCPALFPYLNAPVKTALVIEPAQVIVFAPDQKEGFPDTVLPLKALPTLEM